MFSNRIQGCVAPVVMIQRQEHHKDIRGKLVWKHPGCHLHTHILIQEGLHWWTPHFRGKLGKCNEIILYIGNSLWHFWVKMLFSSFIFMNIMVIESKCRKHLLANRFPQTPPSTTKAGLHCYFCRLCHKFSTTLQLLFPSLDKYMEGFRI